MTNRTRRLLTGVMAVAMAAPLALAGDRCERRSYGRDSRSYYQDGYGYGGYSGYRDSGYRNSDYRDNAYRSGYGGYNNYGYSDNRYDGYSDYRGQRSTGKSAAIIGGGAAAGAVIGGLTGGGKGAAVGAVVGGLGGLVVDRATKDRDRDRYGRRW